MNPHYIEIDENSFAAIFGKEVPGAYPNGTRVVKINTQKGDLHKSGTFGTIRASTGPFRGIFGYLVRWDGTDFEVFIISTKVVKV